MADIATVAVFRQNKGVTEVLIGTRHDDSLALPGGRLDKGESPHAAAVREIKEETGIVATKMTKLAVTTEGKKTIHSFCVKVEPDVKLKPNDDIAKLKWHNINKVPALDRGHNVIVSEGVRKLFGSHMSGTFSDFLKKGGNGLLIVFEGLDGAGKCQKRDTPILMFDGTIKMVQDVNVGDFVMGDDSSQRKVLSVHQGRDEMYRVTPKKGDPHVVNSNHIIVCKIAGKRTDIKKHLCSDGLVRVSAKDFCKESDCWKKNMMLVRKAVEFSEKPVPIDPYILGVWLGDGTSSAPHVTTADHEIVLSLEKEARFRGLRLTVGQSKKTAPVYRIVGNGKKNKNSFLNDLRQCNVFKNKHVPHIYKANCRKVRLAILAGLIDTDGHYSKRRPGCVEFVNKNETLANDVVYIARSLGLAAYVKLCKKKCQTGVEGAYFRVSISGDCHLIPTRIQRKTICRRTINKDVLKVGFKVESIGADDYFGFETDGNHLFLLGDFTVTHNSSQIEMLCKWFKELGIDYVLSKWRSSPLLTKPIDKAKDDRTLTPKLFNLLHAADMIYRYENEISPALEEGKVVVCDRYWYTSMARDAAHGISPFFVRQMYSDLREPDILFYISVGTELACKRVGDTKGLKHYSSGMDVTGAETKEESCPKYMCMQKKVYDAELKKVDSFVRVDSTRSIDRVFSDIKSKVAQALLVSQR